MVVIFVLIIFFSVMISLYITLSGLQKQWEALSIGSPLVVLFLGLGVFLASSRETLRRQMKDAEIADQQKQSELELLRSQLSPHFLFNTLNNLYGLSITQHEKIPALIVKLSDLLRYSVYNTKERFVRLNDEIAYIWNYIELEKIRMADRLLLNMNIEQSISSSAMISPMVLIVFVENAFKHAKNSYEDIVRIDILLRLSEDKIKFSVSNSCDYNEWLSHQLQKKSGIGIANTIRRLDLLYPNEYKLDYRMENNTYYMDLELIRK
jgi:LytS/YehU family sensor histidine kinase